MDGKSITDTVAALGGIDVGAVVDGPMRYPVRVRFVESARNDVGAIASLPVRAENGTVVPLGQLAHVELAPGPSQINRERLRRRITIEVNVRGRDEGSFVEEAQRVIDRERQVHLPPGYFVEWAGEYERLRSAVVPIALALIIVLLFMTFGSARPALLIFFNVPIGISGGIAALAVRGLALSVSAGVGFIALFGVAVLNGLVLVTSIERLRETGLDARAAAERAAQNRLRAVLTTALTTRAGAEVQRPLATVVIGGIVSSTILTLLVLPTAYAWLFGVRRDAS